MSYSMAQVWQRIVVSTPPLAVRVTDSITSYSRHMSMSRADEHKFDEHSTSASTTEREGSLNFAWSENSRTFAVARVCMEVSFHKMPCVYIYVCVCVCVYVYIHIYICVYI